MHLRCRTWETLGRALKFSGMNLGLMANGHRLISPKVVIRIAKFAGVGVDDVLTGRFPAPGTCPHCGHGPTAEMTNGIPVSGAQA